MDEIENAINEARRVSQRGEAVWRPSAPLIPPEVTVTPPPADEPKSSPEPLESMSPPEQKFFIARFTVTKTPTNSPSTDTANKTFTIPVTTKVPEQQSLVMVEKESPESSDSTSTPTTPATTITSTTTSTNTPAPATTTTTSTSTPSANPQTSSSQTSSGLGTEDGGKALGVVGTQTDEPSIQRGSLPVVASHTTALAPRQPRHQDLVSVNSSSVTLQLYTWPSGGCPITRWMVEYRAHSEAAFTAAASHLAGDTDSYTLADLSPLTWYQLRVTAHNTAGATAATYDVATASLTGATLAPESVVEVVDRRGSPLYLDPHILAPVVSGVACTLALLLCVGLLVSRGRAQFMKGGDGGGSGGGSSGGNTYSRSLAEIQNHHNDSQEQLSPPPGPRSKHDEAYSVDEPYEICPYATFSMPPGSNVPPGSAGRGTLDYTLQFHTFGHQECFEGQPAPQRAFAASLMGGRRRDGGCGSAAGASVEIACISSQQTLPISCVRAGGRRGGKKEVEEVEEGEVHGGSESEQDTSGSPGGVRGVPRDTYKVPVRLRRGADFSFHPPDSSTESNDERSPVPPRRPQHLPPTHPQHASHRLHACTPAPPPAQGLRRGFPPRPPTDYSIHV